MHRVGGFRAGFLGLDHAEIAPGYLVMKRMSKNAYWDPLSHCAGALGA